MSILTGVGIVELAAPSFKGEAHLIVGLSGYSLAFIGIFLIIYLVNKNNKKSRTESDEFDETKEV